MNKMNNMNIYEKLEIIKARAINRKLNSKFHRDKENYGNTRLPFGLCKENGIEIGDDWTPEDAWKALEGIGIYHDKVIENLNETGSLEIASMPETSTSKLLNECKKIEDKNEMAVAVYNWIHEIKQGTEIVGKNVHLKKDDGILMEEVNGEWKKSSGESLITGVYYNGFSYIEDLSEKVLDDELYQLREKIKSKFIDAFNKDKSFMSRGKIESILRYDVDDSIVIGLDDGKSIRKYNYDFCECDSNEEPIQPMKIIRIEDAPYKIYETLDKYNSIEIFNSSYDMGVIKENEKYARDHFNTFVSPKSRLYDFLLLHAGLYGCNFLYRKPKKLGKSMEEKDAISYVGGADKTEGSCSSAALAYIAVTNGLDVRDFKGGKICEIFSDENVIDLISQYDGIDGFSLRGQIKDTIETEFKHIGDRMTPNKLYYFATGRHATVIRKKDESLEYLELQSGGADGWNPLNKESLKNRYKFDEDSSFIILIDGEKLAKSEMFQFLAGYINTDGEHQQKGAGGSIK